MRSRHLGEKRRNRSMFFYGLIMIKSTPSGKEGVKEFYLERIGEGVR